MNCIKKSCALLLALFLSLVLLPLPAARADAPKPGDMTARCILTAAQNGASLKNLSDRDYETAWKAGKDNMIRVRCEGKADGVYILWNKAPEGWEIADGADGSILARGGGMEFLHEYRAFARESADFTFRLPDGAAVCELYVLEAGEAPGWVQRWNPPLDKADLLVVSTHADDEHLWYGGLMPVYAGQFHKKVQVAYFIRHGARRTHELLDGLWTVGVTAYPMLSPFPDRYVGSLEAALEAYDEEAGVAYQTMLLRRFKPEVVVDQDIRGEYGHGAHRLNVRTLRKALKISGNPDSCPESAERYGAWEVKKCYLHLYAENQIVMDWDQPLSEFGGKTGMEMAREGYACHVSQVKIGHYRVQDKGKYDNRLFGLYYSSVGPDERRNDLFEHVAPCIPWEGRSRDELDRTVSTAGPDELGGAVIFTAASADPGVSEPDGSSAPPESAPEPTSAPPAERGSADASSRPVAADGGSSGSKTGSNALWISGALVLAFLLLASILLMRARRRG